MCCHLCRAASALASCHLLNRPAEKGEGPINILCCYPLYCLDLNLITNNPPCPPPPFVGAVTPGMCTDAVMHPIDTTRARVQVGVGLGSGPPHSPVRAMWLAFTNTVRTEGVRGLYGGYTTAMLFSAPTNALYFLSYETAKHKLAHSGRFGKPGEGTPSVHLLAGLAAEIGAS